MEINSKDFHSFCGIFWQKCDLFCIFGAPLVKSKKLQSHHCIKRVSLHRSIGQVEHVQVHPPLDRKKWILTAF